MVSELERLLANSYAPYDHVCFSAIVQMKDKTTFGGVTIKNRTFRDTIFAESLAIARAVTAGYKYKDFEAIYIMVGTKNINDLKYLNRDVITEFLEPDKHVYLYDLNRNERILKVGNLVNNIY